MKPLFGMSLKSTSGTSLVEVMVMMVILGISIVGIYSMVDKGKELAMLTDTRLSAVNIARDGLESVTTLRDTFALKGYESGQCDVPTANTNAFFSIDGQILLDIGTDSNCPEMGTNSPTYDNCLYILKDDKSLTGGLVGEPTNFDVCINEFGWYSQEQSMGSLATNANCASPTVGKCSCANTLTLCEANTTQSCKTQFRRKITFTDNDCTGYNAGYCVHVYSRVWWGTSPIDAGTSLVLDQIITTLK